MRGYRFPSDTVRGFKTVFNAGTVTPIIVLRNLSELSKASAIMLDVREEPVEIRPRRDGVETSITSTRQNIQVLSTALTRLTGRRSPLTTSDQPATTALIGREPVSRSVTDLTRTV